MQNEATKLLPPCPQHPRRVGGPVEVWTGQRGTLVYRTRDGWLGVRLDGERRVDEWQSWQVAGVAS